MKRLADAIGEIESTDVAGADVSRSLLDLALELGDQRSRIERRATTDPEIRQVRQSARLLKMPERPQPIGTGRRYQNPVPPALVPMSSRV